MTHLLDRTLLPGVLGLLVALAGVVIVASALDEQNTCRFTVQFFLGTHEMTEGQKNYFKRMTNIVSKVLDKTTMYPRKDWSINVKKIMISLNRDVMALEDQSKDRLRVPFSVFLCIVNKHVKDALAELRSSMLPTNSTKLKDDSAERSGARSENIGPLIAQDSEKHSDVVEDFIKHFNKQNLKNFKMCSDTETFPLIHIRTVNMTAMQKICQTVPETQAHSFQSVGDHILGNSLNITSLREACQADEEKKPILFFIPNCRLSDQQASLSTSPRNYVQENAIVDFQIKRLIYALKYILQSLREVLTQKMKKFVFPEDHSLDWLMVTSIREIYNHADKAAKELEDTIAILSSVTWSTEHNNQSDNNQRNAPLLDLIKLLNSMLTVWRTSRPKDPAEEENPVEKCIQVFKKLKTHLDAVLAQNVSFDTEKYRMKKRHTHTVVIRSVDIDDFLSEFKNYMKEILEDLIFPILFRILLLIQNIINLDFDKILDKAKTFIISLFLVTVAFKTLLHIWCFSLAIGDVRIYGHRLFFCRTCGHVRDEELAALSAGVPVGGAINASQGISPVQQICVVPNERETVAGSGWQKEQKQDEYSMERILKPLTPQLTPKHETSPHSSQNRDNSYTHPPMNTTQEEEDPHELHDPSTSLMSVTSEERRILEETPPPTPSPGNLPQGQTFTFSKEKSKLLGNSR